MRSLEKYCIQLKRNNLKLKISMAILKDIDDSELAAIKTICK